MSEMEKPEEKFEQQNGGIGQHTLKEIVTQPEAWQAALEVAQVNRAGLKGVWEGGRFSEIIVTGCGSTHYLSLAVAPLLQAQTGVRSRAVPASELLLFPELIAPKGGNPLLVTISRSGRTTETVLAARAFKNSHKCPVLNIGCYPGTELDLESDLSLIISEGQEESVVQTRSFSSMLVAAQAVAALLGDKESFDGMETLPEIGRHFMAAEQELARQLIQEGFERFYFLGSGLQYGLASEVNLKMKEMSLSVAEAFHFMEFRHGPMSMVNEKTLVVGLLSDTAQGHELDVLRQMRGLGGKTLALSESPVPADAADFQVNFNSSLPVSKRGVLYLPTLQLLGYYQAIARGLNPDRPHNLTSVVVLNGAG
jgi:glucosamine--fructose-6-phosphate aminotransferase (isomerizing)